MHEALQEASTKAQEEEIKAEEAVTSDPEHAPAYMAHVALGFNQQIERIAEIALVLITGAMLSYVSVPFAIIWFAPLLFLFIRPLSVWLTTAGAHASGSQRGLIAWFGIRGIGSIYYLMYAANHGLPRSVAEQLTAITVVVVAISIVIHGISVTPLMVRYAAQQKKPAEEGTQWP